MAITLTPERIAREPVVSTRQQLTARQANLLNSSHKKLIEANEYFFPNKLHEIEKHVDKITKKTFSSFKEVTAKNIDVLEPDVLNSSIENVISVAKYEGLDESQIFMVLEGVLAERLVDFSMFKNGGLSFTESANFSTLSRDKKLKEIIKEVDKHGFDVVDNFYKIYPKYYEKIGVADTIFDLEAVSKEAEKDLGENKRDHAILNKVRSDIKIKIKSLRLLSKENIAKTKEEETKEFYDALEFNLDYLRYCSPKEAIGKLSALAENYIRQLSKVRDSLEFTKILASSSKLAKLFWSIRLKRNIIGLEKLGLSKKLVERYLKNISDEILLTEAAGYWFEKSTTLLPRYTYSPELALVETIKGTLEAHRSVFSKSSQPVKIMLLINDQTTLKLDISPEASVQDIVQIIKNGQINQNKLDMKSKYELKKESYKVGKKNKDYQKFYQQEDNYKVKFFGKTHNLPFTHQVDGDYIIRLTTQSKRPTVDKNSPFSLFAVNSHKALIDIDLNNEIKENGGRKMSALGFAVKLAHHHSDGKSARPFYEHIFDRLQTKHDDPDKVTLPQIAFLHDVPEIAQHKDEVSSLPIFEADEYSTYSDHYDKFVAGNDKEKTVSPNVLRSTVLSLVNGAPDAHVLTAAKVNPQVSGPFDNVQPVLLSLHPIKKLYEEFKANPSKEFTPEEINQVFTWIKLTKKAEDYGKKGLSTAAVLAAPTGSQQKQISEISAALHKGTALLTRSSGMFSPLPNLNPGEFLDDTIFFTAKSKVYKRKINLDTSTNSLGVIGYTQSTVKSGNRRIDHITYAIRKTPDQAQPAFKKFVSDGLLAKGGSEKKLKATSKIINSLLINWDKLIVGSMSLNDYIYHLEKAYNQLKKESVCGEVNLYASGIVSSFTLQKKLNEVLKQDAKNTISAERLLAEKSFFYGFLNRVNEQYNNEDIKQVVDLLT